MKSTVGENIRFLHDFLKSHYMMTLGTSNGMNIWNTCVFFLSDKWLNLYFMSDLCTESAENAINHPQVALTVIDGMNNLPERPEIQASGICEMINEEKWPRVIELWNKKYKNEELSLEDLKKRHLCLFKIVLTRLKYYDANLAEKVLEFNF